MQYLSIMFWMLNAALSDSIKWSFLFLFCLAIALIIKSTDETDEKLAQSAWHTLILYISGLFFLCNLLIILPKTKLYFTYAQTGAIINDKVVTQKVLDEKEIVQKADLTDAGGSIQNALQG